MLFLGYSRARAGFYFFMNLRKLLLVEKHCDQALEQVAVRRWRVCEHLLRSGDESHARPFLLASIFVFRSERLVVVVDRCRVLFLQTRFGAGRARRT